MKPITEDIENLMKVVDVDISIRCSGSKLHQRVRLHLPYLVNSLVGKPKIKKVRLHVQSRTRKVQHLTVKERPSRTGQTSMPVDNVEHQLRPQVAYIRPSPPSH